ncbi:MULTISPECIES: dihydrofolate reductase family protein [Gordonia]|uniref:Dihydrofolate reductase family protein n=1 Tax=Gordonia tangerina TaxID=2911060 RepID=A0ABS9DU38_9ACTN|nr:dihydrofolate reductase family protein [Gordonia tangerina]MCF3941343.1 dihydrofolate reductase family protein [Gordonia tangerina]
MRPLRYSINITLDGCCDHREILPDDELHRRAADNLARADALLFGRVTYQLMEDGWRYPVPPGTRPEWMDAFAETISSAKKYVVSATLEHVDWNAELLRGNLADEIRRLKDEPGEGILTGGVALPQALAELGLIDEYEFVVHPRVVGTGRRLFEGLPAAVDLELVGRTEYACGATALTYVPASGGAASP